MSYQNHGLFSDYYLQAILPTLPPWSEARSSASAFQAIRAEYARLKDELPTYSEAQTEEYFIKPVLKILGHHIEIQPLLHTALGVNRPDYAFFATKEDLKAARKHLGENEFFKAAIAIGDAKAWKRDLDRRSHEAKDAFSNANPNYQIDLSVAKMTWKTES